MIIYKVKIVRLSVQSNDERISCVSMFFCS